MIKRWFTIVVLSGLLAVVGAEAQTPLIQALDWDCVRPFYVIAGDFNGDGWDDIALACHSCDTIMVALNPTQQSCPVEWGALKAYKLSDSPVGLAWGMFGKGVGPYVKEIVGITQYTPAWTVFNTDDPKASLRPLELVTATHVALGDFNGDGGLEIAVLDSLGLSIVFLGVDVKAVRLSSSCTLKVEVHHSGLVPVALSDESSGEPAFLNTADFDRDGDLDLVVSSGTSLLFFENDGTGLFSLRVKLPVGLSLRAIAVADLDGDADADLAVVDPKFGALAVIENQGCWRFDITARIKMDLGPVFVVAFDCDRDGDQDLTVAQFDGNCIFIAYNNGSGKFSVERTYDVGNDPIGLAVGDFDRNGIPDLVVALNGGGPAGAGPAAQIIYNPCCALDDCGETPPCCGTEPPPSGCKP